MTSLEVAILLGSGMLTGVINSLAGGGSFIAFPVLVFLGLLPINANATATLAILPGTFATIFAYRKELAVHNDKLRRFITISLLGGLVGAAILLHISNAEFAIIVPYLLLTATLLFTFRTRLIAWIRKKSRSSEDLQSSPAYKAIMMAFFVIIAIYGGFFGAGMGIMLLALFSLMGMQNLHEMNALRSCSGFFSNLIAAAMFCFAGIVEWKIVFVMSIGCIIGGYFGAFFALKLPQSISRNAVIIIAWGMTIYFFFRG